MTQINNTSNNTNETNATPKQNTEVNQPKAQDAQKVTFDFDKLYTDLASDINHIIGEADKLSMVQNYKKNGLSTEDKTFLVGAAVVGGIALLAGGLYAAYKVNNK